MIKQTTTVIDGVSIAALNRHGTNGTVLIIHGNSMNAESFRQVLSSPSLGDVDVWAMDLPGHGKSDRPNTPEEVYNLPGYARVLSQFIEANNLENLLLVGHSLGGHIVLEAVPQLSILKGCMIFGTPPLAVPPDMEGAFNPHPAMGYAFAPDLDEMQAGELAAAFVGEGVPTADIVSSILETDPNARVQMGASIGALNYADEVEICNNLDVPILVAHASNDPLVQRTYLDQVSYNNWYQGKVIEFASGHSPQVEAPEEVAGVIGTFLSDLQ